MKTIEEWHRDGFTVSCDPTRLDFNFVHGFLTSSYWSPGIPIETLKKAIGNSLAFGVFEGNRQVGFARVVTDFATFGYLADVFIAEPWRGKGLSKWLMECVMAHPHLQGLRRFSLVTRDAHGLYAQFGFQALANPGRHMEIVRPDIYLATRPPSTIR